MNHDTIDKKIEPQRIKLNDITKIINDYKLKYKENFDFINDLIEKHQNFLESPSLEIAIVGSIKAGKSTLINSILNEEVSSMEVTPETASLTKIRYSEFISLKVNFYSKKEWDSLWESAVKSRSKSNLFRDGYDKLSANLEKDKYLGEKSKTFTFETIEELRIKVKKFSSSQSATHYFVKEIEVGVPFFPFSKQVCLVDTPGLNDVIEYRSNITKKYIKRANIILICVSSDAMRNDEYLTIVKTFENIATSEDRVFVLGTKLDKLNNPIKDWEKQKEEWKKYFKTIYKNPQNLKNNILGVSAYINYLLDKISNNKKLNENEEIDIINYCKKNGIEFQKNNFIGKISNLFTNDISKIKRNFDKINGITNIDKFIERLNKNDLKDLNFFIMKELDFRYNNIIKELKIKIEKITNNINENQNVINMEISELKKEEKKLLKKRDDLQWNKKQITSAFKGLKVEIMNEMKKIKRKTKMKLKFK